MTDIDLGSTTLVLRRQNKTEGEGDKKVVVGVEYYTLSMKGEKGITALGRINPDAFDDAVQDVIDDRVRERLDTFRKDVEGALRDASTHVTDARTSFNERTRTAFSKLGIGRMRKPHEEGEGQQ